MSEGDLQTLADEYVIGLLSDADQDAAEARLVDDPAFAAAVAEATERFLEIDLTERTDAVAASGWAHIEERLDATPATGAADATPADDKVVHFKKAEPASAPAAGGWKPTALAAMAASLLLAVALGWQVSRPAPLMVAVLMDSEGEPRLLIEAFADDQARVIPLDQIDIPTDKTLEVWTLPNIPDAKPVSLGQLTQAQTRELQGPDLPMPETGQLYEITLEPAGGSPTGLPTGPIIGKGFAKQLL